jgi:hypothetical protein
MVMKHMKRCHFKTITKDKEQSGKQYLGSFELNGDKYS